VRNLWMNGGFPVERSTCHDLFAAPLEWNANETDLWSGLRGSFRLIPLCGRVQFESITQTISSHFRDCVDSCATI
jgi:hypothetical protein